MPETAVDNPETQSEVGASARFWLSEIEAAKERACDWYEKAEEAEDRYRDDQERPFGSLNIFWANVEVQRAAIGEDFGKPQVTRVNAPENDGGLSRHIANVWERSVAAAVRDTNDNHDIALAVNDVFIPGKGQVWLELEVISKGEDGKPTWVSAPLVRVPYKDYLEGPATRWGDTPWVARGHLFTRDELISQCKISEEEADKVPLNVQLPFENRKSDKADRTTRGREQFKRARVWEIWTRYPEKARLYVAEGHDEVLCWDADPFRLKGFFPCPRPMLANGDEGWQAPLTDYSRYEDQAKELDRLSERIFVLTETLKRRGVYDKQFAELQDLAKSGDNVLVAVENFGQLLKAGGGNGLAGVVLWEDLTPTITVLRELHVQRNELVKLIYELSGISDLARGHTDPDETLGAQRLKQSFGSSRFRKREKESRRFAAEAYAIKAEIIAELFPREQLQEMCGIKLPLQKEIDEAQAQLQQIMQFQQQAKQAGMQVPPPNQEQVAYLMQLAQTRFSWEKTAQVLQSDYRRCYHVECETDQTNFIDEEADKQARTQFFTTAMQTLQQIGPMIQGNPKNGEIFKQMMMFVISSFRAGRGLEEGLERAVDEAIQLASQQQGQQQPDPKAAAEAQAAQFKLQTAQIGLQKAQLDLQAAQVSTGANAQVEAQKAQLSAQQAAIKVFEAQGKAKATQDTNQAKAVGHQIDMQNKAEQLEFERARRATAEEVVLSGPTKTSGAQQ
jgi:hypothetical protein